MDTETRPSPPAFDRAAPRYDLLNALMSLGRDGSWRERLSRPLAAGEKVLDVCCGSGRSAVAAHRRTAATVFGVDVSPAMLRLGREHARRQGARFAPVRGDALRLPFRDEAFDAVTVAWGLRNLAPEGQALAELRRVLRSGGMLHVLDSPAPAGGLAGSLHRLYLRRLVPFLGRLSPDATAYRYLAESVLAFGTAERVAGRLAEAGFEVAPPARLFLGAAVVWRARRPHAGARALRNARRDPKVSRSAGAAGGSGR